MVEWITTVIKNQIVHRKSHRGTLAGMKKSFQWLYEYFLTLKDDTLLV